MLYTFEEYKQSPILRDHIKLGTKSNGRDTVTVNSLYFEKNGKPHIDVMGEIHFSRISRGEWRDRLLKMKAGGITIVSTYLFWIYHEEIEGEFDFTGDLDVKAFIETAGEVGLDVIIRIGPWAHGECRNGGFPDWLLEKPFKCRDNNPGYMAQARIWYEKIYEQVSSLLWKNGGNIIGIQFENELVDNAEHLKALKEMALEIGFDAPLYTVTGWNSKFGARIPVDEAIPVFSAYVDAPWADHINKLPPSPHYVFDTRRNDAAVGTDVMQDESSDEDGWRLPYERYPFATCELGSGLQSTHHRRIVVSPMDVYAMALVKLGSGNNLPGYYMYCGGTNKIGRLSTFQETRATGYPNDYPVLNYDFQTAITQYGEVNPQYGYLNILHLFTDSFGEVFAPMETVMSGETLSPDDFKSLRYCMRTDGRSGFVFVNHYQRYGVLEDCYDVEIDTGLVKLPAINVTGPVSFFMPFNMDLNGMKLEYATAQPICRQGNTYLFAAIDGITPEYKFEGMDVCRQDSFTASLPEAKENLVRIVTLPFAKAAFLRKFGSRLVLGDGVNLYEDNEQIKAIEDGSFTYYEWKEDEFIPVHVQRQFNKAHLTMESVDPQFGLPYPEEMELGGARRLSWKKLEVDSQEGYIEINDACDAEQIYADGELVADKFYDGVTWRIPAKLLYGRECYLVTSELREDCFID